MGGNGYFDFVAYLMGRRVEQTPGQLQALCEAAIGGVYDYMVATLESRKLAKRFFR